MNAIISQAARRVTVRTGAGRRSVDPVVAEIVAALRVLGGSAHRQRVADQIAQTRTGRPLPATREVSELIFEAFRRHAESTGGRRAAPLFHTPFGAGSYRWALTPDRLGMGINTASPAIREHAH